MSRDLAELREALGLRPDASDAEVQEACRDLERFLAPERVPRRLRRWAEQQRGAVARALPAAPEPPASTAGAAAAPAPVPPAVPVVPAVPANGELGEGVPDYFGEDVASVRAPARRARAAPARPPASVPGRRPAASRGRTSGWQTLVLVGALALVAIGLVVASPQLLSGLGGLAGSGGAAQSAQRSAPSLGVGGRPAAEELDQVRVAELKAVVEKEPQNVDALFDLGELHFQARRWQESIDWFTRLLAVEPDNLHARTDVGTAQFNLGRLDLARQAWEEVALRAPDDPQIHYNLGFLYASSEPRDLERAAKEWETVARLAPDTDLAKTALAHLAALRK